MASVRSCCPMLSTLHSVGLICSTVHSFSTLFPEDNEIGRYLKKRLPDTSKKQRREVSGLMWQAVVAGLLELGRVLIKPTAKC